MRQGCDSRDDDDNDDILSPQADDGGRCQRNRGGSKGRKGGRQGRQRPVVDNHAPEVRDERHYPPSFFKRATAVHEDPERFVRVVLTAFQDGTAEVFATLIRADLFLALLLNLGALALLLATPPHDCIERSTTNGFGDRDVPCEERVSTAGHEACYRRVDRTGRVLYVRNSSGVHFEMNQRCSVDAPENEELKCKGEWSVVESTGTSAWYFRLYQNVTARDDDEGRYSFLSGVDHRHYHHYRRHRSPLSHRSQFRHDRTDDDRGADEARQQERERNAQSRHNHFVAPTFRVVFRSRRANWIVSNHPLPRDEHPETDVFFDGEVFFAKAKVDGDD